MNKKSRHINYICIICIQDNMFEVVSHNTVHTSQWEYPSDFMKHDIMDGLYYNNGYIVCLNRDKEELTNILIRETGYNITDRILSYKGIDIFKFIRYDKLSLEIDINTRTINNYNIAELIDIPWIYLVPGPQISSKTECINVNFVPILIEKNDGRPENWFCYTNQSGNKLWHSGAYRTRNPYPLTLESHCSDKVDFNKGFNTSYFCKYYGTCKYGYALDSKKIYCQ